MTRTTTKLAAVFSIVLALAVVTLYAFQAEAREPRHYNSDGNRTAISVSNSSELEIEAEVKAESGDAEAEGGEAGDGGNGGDAAFGTGGAGGNGGNGGIGGTAISGDAGALGTIYADINSTRIMVERCDCEEEENLFLPTFFMPNQNRDDEEALDVSVRNRLVAEIELEVEAESGDTEVDGGDGEEGGNGGDVGQNRNPWMMWYLWNTGTGGAGGAGGRGGDGGRATSGLSTADGLTDVLINETVIRVPRTMTEADE